VLLAALAVALTVLAVACGGGDATGPAPAPTASVATDVAVTDAAATYEEDAAPAGDIAGAIRTLPPASSSPTLAAAGPQPVELHIDALAVSGAPVVPVGVLPSGELEVPAASEVGWYRYGPGPGEPGAMVMAAHIAYDGVDGVFADLAELAPGATVEVVLEDQRVVTYVVTELTSYAKTALPREEIFGPGGESRLVLISCGGRFDPMARSYDSNVVAYAQPADQLSES
jgi:hypothetical protein